MDNTLNLKLEEFKKTLNTLEEVLNEKKTDIVRDSVIKRFEYNFDSCWKTAKVLLEKKFGVEVFSPKLCFRELRKNSILSDEETELFLKMTNDRNAIIHKYGEELSEELYKKVKKNYFKEMKKLYLSMKDIINK